jgi:hypothetical protein
VIRDPGTGNWDPGTGIRNPGTVIRDTGYGSFLTLDPGSGMGKKSGSGTGILIRDAHPGHISESLKTNFWVKILLMRIRDGKIWIRDPGWKNSDPGSRIRNTDIFKFFANFQRSLILRIINLKKASIFKLNEQ